MFDTPGSSKNQSGAESAEGLPVSGQPVIKQQKPPPSFHIFCSGLYVVQVNELSLLSLYFEIIPKFG